MRRRLVLLGLLPAFGLGWWWFRPDALVLDRRVDEPSPLHAGNGATPSATLLAVGHFHDASHEGSGTVTIHRLGDGRRVVRLAELRVDNGPDLHLYLVSAADARDDATVEQSRVLSLGRLKGNLGNQTYDIPAAVDLSSYRSVTIWCRRFGKNFATAPLMME